MGCLRLPPTQDVSLTFVFEFPFILLLDNECKSLRGLTLHDCQCFWRNLHANVVTDGSSHPNGRLPFIFLCLQGQSGERSFKISSDSNPLSLVVLYLDIGSGGSLFTFPELSLLSIPCCILITTHLRSGSRCSTVTSHLFSLHFHISRSRLRTTIL